MPTEATTEAPPEIEDARDAVDNAAGRARGRGQHWRVTTAERKAIEMRAMKLATWLSSGLSRSAAC